MIGTGLGAEFGVARPLVLAAILCVLAGGIAFEIQGSGTGATAQSPVPRESGVVPTVQVGGVGMADSLRSWRDQILSRPLFSPDRRPVEAAVQSVSGLPRLTGMILTDSRKVAIFASPSGGRSIVAEEGSRVGVYEVRTITNTSVTVAGPDGMTVLKPNFDPAPVANPRVPPPAPAPRPPAPGRPAR